MLVRMGVATGVDLTALAESVPWVEQQLGKPVPGLVSQAGLFPAGALRRDGSGHRAHQGAHEVPGGAPQRSEEHTSELQSLMRTSYAVFCLKKKKKHQ